MHSWSLTYEGFDPQQERLREALCTLGNGRFATRGAAPESSANEVHYPGTYLAGGYNRVQSELADRLLENEDLVNLPNWLALTFRIEDGDWFDLHNVELLTYRQELNLRQGSLTRRVRFCDAQGRRTTLTQRRFVHMAQPYLAGLETTWLPENWSGRIDVRSALDGTVLNRGVARYRNLNDRHLVPLESASTANDAIHLMTQTSQSELRIATAARTWWFDEDRPLDPPARIEQNPGIIAQHYVKTI